ncbi:putative protein OS=Streptomyces griseomycini OX=66895 GN=FHS37_003307 PE=4 SV=1 [Streptomyces griseomycini]
MLLDYTTNGDVADPASPLSHAALVRLYIEGRWPREGDADASDAVGDHMR